MVSMGVKRDSAVISHFQTRPSSVMERREVRTVTGGPREGSAVGKGTEPRERPGASCREGACVAARTWMLTPVWVARDGRRFSTCFMENVCFFLRGGEL
jgi:hypothetical protein